MAAAIQTQIGKVEEKFKKYLHGTSIDSYWNTLESKTKLKREQFALGITGFLAIYLTLGWACDFLCNLLGFLYPAYASILAVETKVANDDTLWLMYWIVYCSFGFIEYVAYSFFQTLPFYWLLKCIFLVWLMMPGATGGSYILYHRFIRRLIKPSKTN